MPPYLGPPQSFWGHPLYFGGPPIEFGGPISGLGAPQSAFGGPFGGPPIVWGPLNRAPKILASKIMTSIVWGPPNRIWGPFWGHPNRFGAPPIGHLGALLVNIRSFSTISSENHMQYPTKNCRNQTISTENHMHIPTKCVEINRF